MASYREPGVYMSVVDKTTNTTIQAPRMVPFLIGTASDKIETYVQVTRSSTLAYDVITGVSAVADIISVGFKPTQSYFVVGSSGDCTASLVTEGEDSEIRLTWSESGQAKIIAGSTYYVRFYKDLDLSESGIITLYASDIGNIPSILGPYLFKNTAGETQINHLALCSYLALLNGAPILKVLSVETADAASYSTALENYAFFDEAVWRIVPTDTPYTATSAAFKAIHLAIDNHIKTCSTYVEKKERTGIYGFASSTVDLQAVENYAKSKSYYRVTTPYPNVCDIQIPDGDIVTNLGPEFICAAYAGYEASVAGYVPKTRGKLTGIYRLKNTKLTRTKMNELAEAGVMVLTQPDGDGGSVVIRHQLTTDTENTTPGLNENSIVSIRDYVAKRARQVCDAYIGGTNISADLTTRIKASLDSELASLASEGYILSGAVEGVEQDSTNPSAVYVALRIFVPHPCNYIDITMYAE